jgi:hypothetical protein
MLPFSMVSLQADSASFTPRASRKPLDPPPKLLRDLRRCVTASLLHFSAFFCAVRFPKLFAINRLRALSAKHPGVAFPLARFVDGNKTERPSPAIPLLATLAWPLYLIENSTTLSPVFATLTRSVTSNPFVCHSYTKHPGVARLRHPSLRSYRPHGTNLLLARHHRYQVPRCLLTQGNNASRQPCGKFSEVLR